MTGKLVMKMFEKVYVARPSIRTKDVKILMCHIYAHQNVTSAEEDFNQVAKMLHSVASSHYFFSHSYHCPIGS